MGVTRWFLGCLQRERIQLAEALNRCLVTHFTERINKIKDHVHLFRDARPMSARDREKLGRLVTARSTTFRAAYRVSGLKPPSLELGIVF